MYQITYVLSTIIKLIKSLRNAKFKLNLLINMLKPMQFNDVELNMREIY